MNLQMRLMILIDERLGRLTVHDVHVLSHRVFRLGVLRGRDDLVRVLDTQRLNHLPMQILHVVDVWRSLRQLQHRLVLHDLLRHRSRVRITDRDDIHIIVVSLFGLAITDLWLVRILIRGIVTDDRSEEFELLLHRVVDASLNRCHDLENPLKHSEGRANRSLRGHVADLEIRHCSEATTILDHLVHQHGKSLARLLVRQRQDVVAHRTRRNVYVSPLAGSDGCVVSLDTQTA